MVAMDYQEQPPLRIAVLPFVDHGNGEYMVDKIPLSSGKNEAELNRSAWTHANRYWYACDPKFISTPWVHLLECVLEGSEAVLLGLRNRMKSGRVIALTFQTRRRGAINEDTRRGAEGIAASLQRVGFESVRIATLEMRPVNAASVLAKASECGANEPC